jgi:dTDP-4-amino-4,6-dideoxygalactose transaminase
LFDLTPALTLARADAERHVAAIFSSGRFILGDQVQGLEREFAAAMGGVAAVGTGTGTAAIELCLRAAQLPTGAEVVVPANTSLFTAQAVLSAGFALRFADVDPATLQLTAASAAAAWTPRTAAVIAVHLFGNAAPVAELAALCQARQGILIQDACQAHGLCVAGQPLTHFSPFTAYSFYPTKNLGGVGDGGAVVTTPELAAHIRFLRDGGRDNDQYARHPGINSRLGELQAAYLRALLPHLAHWNQHRARIAAIYDQALASVAPVPRTASVHHLYVVRTPLRDPLRAYLREQGIETGVHYSIPLHAHPAFSPRATWTDLPVAETAADQIVSLPIGPHVSPEMAHHVAAQMERFFA